MSAAVSKHSEELEINGGLKGTDIANLASVSTATVSRWKNGSATPRPEDELRLSDMLYVVERLSEYYNRDEIRRWLHAPHPQLDGEKAFDLVHADRTKEVLAVIARLDAEVYL